MKKIIFAVSTDLNYDQRMIRICTSLTNNGHNITIAGRTTSGSVALTGRIYTQKRLKCFFEKGFLFYLEFNLRLFFFLTGKKADCICAIDLDTILPCYFASVFKKAVRVYDAHELFCEMKEIVNRPLVFKIWKGIEKFTVPKFKHGYTVNQRIAAEFEKMYQVKYEVVRNITLLKDLYIPQKKEKYILYQGSVNQGRSFETLIPAMQYVNCNLIICGDGNFMIQTRRLVKQYKLEDKVIFKGKIEPRLLTNYTLGAHIGITLFENNGLNNYLSLANRFFDYMHSAVPQLCAEYPAYKEINNLHEVAVLIKDLSAESIAENCNRLLYDDGFYKHLQQNCLKAREVYNWQNEQKKLIGFYTKILL